MRWFGHVQRKTFVAPVWRVESIIVEGKKSRGRPKRTWDEQRKVDLHELNLSEGLTTDVLLDYLLMFLPSCVSRFFIISFFCFLYLQRVLLIYFIYMHLIYLSRVTTSPYLFRAGGLLWSRSPLRVSVAAVFPSPDLFHSFSMSRIHWVG